MIYEQGKIIERILQLEIWLGEMVRQQGMTINQLQGQLAQFETNMDHLVAKLNKRDQVIDWEEGRIHEQLNQHHYNLGEQDKVIWALECQVEIQMQEINSLKEWVCQCNEHILDMS